MTDRSSRPDKIRRRRNGQRDEPAINDRPRAASGEPDADDFWGLLERLLGRPVVLIDAPDLARGDYSKAYRVRGRWRPTLH
jgi:hypothetical protein